MGYREATQSTRDASLVECRVFATGSGEPSLRQRMPVVGRIAAHVFRESVRRRVPYSSVLFTVMLIAAASLAGPITAGQTVKIVKDLGLAAIQGFGLLIAAFVGAGLVSREVERGSIYSVLSKPVRRRELILGDYAGLTVVLAVNAAVMAVVLYAVLGGLSLTAAGARQSWEAPVVDPAMLSAIVLIVAQSMLVGAVALFFSTFSSPGLSVVLTAGVYVAGHLSADLRQIEGVVDSQAVRYLATAAYHLLPNLAAFDVKAQVVHAQPVPLGYLAVTVGYALPCIGAFLVAAMFIFSRRDLT